MKALLLLVLSLFGPSHSASAVNHGGMMMDEKGMIMNAECLTKNATH